MRRLVVTLLALAVAGCVATAPGLGPVSGVHASSPVAAALRTPPPNCRRYGACSIESCFGAICIAYATDGSVQTELIGGIIDAQGIAADRQGNAYIADSGNSEIFKYGPYFKTLLKTYQDSGQTPLSVDVDAEAKLLAVSNKSTASGGPGSVSVYAGGSLTPTSTLSDSNVPHAAGIGIAIDGSGNCFWSLYDPNSGVSKIDEFASCAGSAITVVSGKPSLAGMAFDKENDLFYTSVVSSTKRDIFKCRGTTHCRVLATNFARPLMIAFDKKWRFLWLDDVGVLEGPLIESINPRTGRVVSSFRAGSSSDPPFGIAHAPGPAY